MATQSRLETVLVGLLVELARLLMDAGIKDPAFSRMSRLAFFRAAARQAKFSNDRPNQSAIAAMTGLTRVQVRSFATRMDPRPADKRDRIEALLDAWIGDESHVKKGPGLVKLRISGGGRTFEALVKKHGGDLPVRSILREMQRQKYVSVRGNYAFLRPLARQTLQQARLFRLSKALTHLLAAPLESSSAELIQAETVEVQFPSSSRKGRVWLRRKTKEELKLALDRLLAAGVSASEHSPALAGSTRLKTKTSILLISENVARELGDSRFVGRRRRH